MDAISSLGSNQAQASATPDAFSALNSEQFVKIMFTELTRQDPLKPNDTSNLLQQMSSLRSIQSSLDLSKRLESLVLQNQTSAAGTLIGKSVSGLDERNLRVTGVVESVSITKDGPVLGLTNGSRVSFDRVDSLAAASQSAR
ncbi:MAG: hypothetical protein KF745_02230 [Phycisphaeraceae bacterium]|nr:hypothetical protein [Phycisphaeraceae bacterium]